LSYRPTDVANQRIYRTRLTGIIALALVLGELKPETLLRVRNPFYGGERNLELAIAEGADCNGGHLTEPFDHSKITFRHSLPFRRQRRLSLVLDARFADGADKISEPKKRST
jgi:hypothetical protein